MRRAWRQACAGNGQAGLLCHQDLVVVVVVACMSAQASISCPACGWLPTLHAALRSTLSGKDVRSKSYHAACRLLFGALQRNLHPFATAL